MHGVTCRTELRGPSAVRTQFFACTHEFRIATGRATLPAGRMTTQKDRDTSWSKRAGEKGSGCGDDTRTEKAGGCRRTPRVRAKNHPQIACPWPAMNCSGTLQRGVPARIMPILLQPLPWCQCLGIWGPNAAERGRTKRMGFN